jgi:hypothetical protein
VAARAITGDSYEICSSDNLEKLNWKTLKYISKALAN